MLWLKFTIQNGTQPLLLVLRSGYDVIILRIIAATNAANAAEDI